MRPNLSPPRSPFDSRALAFYHCRLMSAALPEKVDALRAVTARREYQGSITVRSLLRLRESLESHEGDIDYRLSFGRDVLGISYLDLDLVGQLRLVCQRTLEPFDWPLRLSQRMGLIRDETGESALPEGYEPLMHREGEIFPHAVIEDEVLLALPLIPVSPGSEAAGEWMDPEDEIVETTTPNPFAALARLKS